MNLEHRKKKKNPTQFVNHQYFGFSMNYAQLTAYFGINVQIKFGWSLFFKKRKKERSPNWGFSEALKMEVNGDNILENLKAEMSYL